MTLPDRSPSPTPASGRRLAVSLGLLVLLTLLPAATGVVAAAEPGGPKGGAGLQPTIQYADAQKHAHDKIAFRAGGRVTVGFTPRSTDRWKVDGKAPRRLPAGRQTGGEMRILQPKATGDAAVGIDASVDRPAVDPSTSIPSTSAAWDATSGDGAIDLAAAVDPGALRREVFGFLPYWELTDTSTRLDWAAISTVAYFGVGADGKGNLQKKNSDGSTTVGWSGWTSSKMTSVINAAHKSHARVVLTVQSFAWSTTGLARQKALLGSSTARANLASQIAKAVRDRGADGVNLDFEPLASGYGDEFTALVRKVRSALNATAPGYQLTFDTLGFIGNYPVADATAAGGADAIMIMGYDYRSSGASVAGSIAPIKSAIYDLTDTLAAYLARVPASKLMLGVPYYGRAWSTLTDDYHAPNVSGTKYGASSTANYTTARQLAADHGRHYNATEGVAWTAYERETCTASYGCVDAWRQLYYDDATALKAKYDLVNGKGLRGIGIWALGYDGTRTELYQAIKDKFIKDAVAPTIASSTLTSAIISPNGDGRFDTTTAKLSATALIRWGYKVQPWNGTTAGASIRSGSTTGKTPSFTWNGRNASGVVVPNGRYRLTLWVADASDNRSQKPFIITVDTKRPAVTTKAGHGFFSPDGDGHDDTMPFAWTSSQAIHGTVRILDSGGTSRRLWKYDARKTWSATWKGTDDHGAVLPDGRYTYRVNGRDAAGNLRIVDRKILLDRTLKSHTWSDYAFDPRAGQTSRLTVSLRRSASLTVSIYAGSTRIKRIWLAKTMATGNHGWTWNGRKSDGTYAKAGTYHVVVLATSKYGTTRWTRSVKILAH